ncbi:hypothetical protein FRB95_001227 [Tulasnella sp. JGI-2019a]|nr:hypothetical protein FRB95_001227 [Tulasnella sp. JGI-2019a]
MVNVKSLSLRDFHWIGTPSQTRICDAICSTVSLISLTALVIQNCDVSTHERQADHKFQLRLILQHHPLLERLNLWSGHWDLGQWILPTDVPHLTHLTSRPREATVLVPGRPVTSLSLTHVLTMPNQDFWEALALSTGPIHTLKMDIYDPEALLLFLQSLSVHLPDVRKLILDGPNYEDLPTLPQGFPSFRSLRTIHIPLIDCLECTLHDLGSDSQRDDQRADFTARIRLKCPRFERLDYGLFSLCGCGIL